jgi:hypothetical protein
MTKMSQLLGRLEEQAVRIHILEAEGAREKEEHDRARAALRRENADLQRDVVSLSQPRDPEGKKAHAYDELHRMTLDAHSLIERDDLTDADKVKSIHGLVDQVVGRDWFAGNPHKPAAARKARKTKTPPSVLSDIPIEVDAFDDDALRAEVEAEPETDEDAREFARDY